MNAVEIRIISAAYCPQFIEYPAGTLGDVSNELSRLHIVQRNFHSYEFPTPLNLLRGLSQQANYTDLETTACRRSYCQLLRIEGATWSA
jgi:hypothetical protein